MDDFGAVGHIFARVSSPVKARSSSVVVLAIGLSRKFRGASVASKGEKISFSKDDDAEGAASGMFFIRPSLVESR